MFRESLPPCVTPSATWRKAAAPLAAADGGADLLRQLLTDALNSRSTERPHRWEFEGRTFETAGPDLVDANVILVRGAMWAAAGTAEAWVPELLGGLGLHYGTSGTSSNVARDERQERVRRAAKEALKSGKSAKKERHGSHRSNRSSIRPWRDG